MNQKKSWLLASCHWGGATKVPSIRRYMCGTFVGSKNAIRYNSCILSAFCSTYFFSECRTHFGGRVRVRTILVNYWLSEADCQFNCTPNKQSKIIALNSQEEHQKSSAIPIVLVWSEYNEDDVVSMFQSSESNFTMAASDPNVHGRQTLINDSFLSTDPRQENLLLAKVVWYERADPFCKFQYTHTQPMAALSTSATFGNSTTTTSSSTAQAHNEALTVYLQPLLEKHAHHESIIYEDLAGSLRAAQTFLQQKQQQQQASDETADKGLTAIKQVRLCVRRVSCLFVVTSSLSIVSVGSTLFLPVSTCVLFSK